MLSRIYDLILIVFTRVFKFWTNSGKHFRKRTGSQQRNHMNDENSDLLNFVLHEESYNEGKVKLTFDTINYSPKTLFQMRIKVPFSVPFYDRQPMLLSVNEIFKFVVICENQSRLETMEIDEGFARGVRGVKKFTVFDMNLFTTNDKFYDDKKYSH